MHEAAVRAASRVGEAVGVRVADRRVLYCGSSVIVSLGADGPIARVGGLTAGVRDLSVHYAREVQVARFLAVEGAPVVHPWQPAGPFSESGQIVSLWHRADTSVIARPEAAGKALRRCHEALRGFAGALPPLSWLVEEAARIVGSVSLEAEDRVSFDNAIRFAHRLLITHGLPEQPLHGDAGMGNVLGEGVWHDWEDCCRGPLIWDLAATVSSARILGRESERAEATLSAYGHAPGLDLLDEFVAVRGLHVLAWSLLASADEGRLRATTQARLQWLRAHPWPT